MELTTHETRINTSRIKPRNLDTDIICLLHIKLKADQCCVALGIRQPVKGGLALISSLLEALEGSFHCSFHRRFVARALLVAGEEMHINHGGHSAAAAPRALRR